MDDAPLVVNTVGSHHIAIVGQEWVDKTVVATEKDKQNGQVLFNEQVAQCVLRRFAYVFNILSQRLSLIATVLLARQPSDPDRVEIWRIRLQAAPDMRPHRRISQFG